MTYVILIVVVRLGIMILKSGPCLILIFVLPLHFMKDIGWHAQEASSSNIAMVIGFHLDVLTHYSVFDNEGRLVRQGYISLGIISIYDVRTASVLKGLCFFPVH